METENNQYQKQWGNYRKLRNRYFGIVFSPILFSVLLGLILNAFGLKLKVNQGFHFLIVVIWGILFLINTNRFYQ